MYHIKIVAAKHRHRPRRPYVVDVVSVSFFAVDVVGVVCSFAVNVVVGVWSFVIDVVGGVCSFAVNVVGGVWTIL